MRGLFAGIGRDLPRVYIINGGTRVGYDLAPRCLVSVNGRQCRLEDLAEGDEVAVEGRPAVSVKASRSLDKPLPPPPPPPPRGWTDDGRGYPTPTVPANADANRDADEDVRRFLPPPVPHAEAASSPVHPPGIEVVEVGPGSGRVETTDDSNRFFRTFRPARREPTLTPRGR